MFAPHHAPSPQRPARHLPPAAAERESLLDDLDLVASGEIPAKGGALQLTALLEARLSALLR